ncbi:MAG: DUF3307 domain-containing protein [Gallionella sp.]|jgi:hypothetical protein
MEQLILHLIGDYVTQTDWMAKYKTRHIGVAMIHVTVYTLPFLLLSPSMLALAVIFVTHVLIDRYRLARYVIYAKNKLTEPGLRWENASKTGFHNEAPQWLAVWLSIIVDNTMHLTINYAALRWL